MGDGFYLGLESVCYYKDEDNQKKDTTRFKVFGWADLPASFVLQVFVRSL